MLAKPGASFRREATKGLPGGSLLQAGDCAIILVQEGKTVSGFKRLFAYLVTEKLPRFACLLPARCQQKQAARRESLVLL